MSDNNNERRELTAAELDLVVGAAIYMKIEGIDGSFMAPRNGETTSAGTGNSSVSVMYDITQNRT